MKHGILRVLSTLVCIWGSGCSVPFDYLSKRPQLTDRNTVLKFASSLDQAGCTTADLSCLSADFKIDSSQGGDPYYSGQVYIASDASSSTRTLASAEIAAWLAKGSNQTYTVNTLGAEVPLNGIILVRADSKELQKITLQPLRKLIDGVLGLSEPVNAFAAYSDGGGPLWIIGKNDLSLANGAYTYLDRIGYRWLLPNSHWTIVPALQKIRVTVAKIYRTKFASFSGGGTGGWGTLSLLDNAMKAAGKAPPRDLWDRWFERSRFPNQIKFGGHTGEAFNAKYYDILRNDPLYLAEVNGVRQQLPDDPKVISSVKQHSTYHGKKCVNQSGLYVTCPQGVAGTEEDPNDYQSYDGLIKLYTDWSLGNLVQQTKMVSSRDKFVVLSTEPADGGGFCNCTKCKNLLRNGPYLPHVEKDSVESDLVLHLTNEVSKKVRELFPGHFTSVLGYGDHAEVPTIPIEPNTYVLLAPYAYQKTGLSPENLIIKWGEKQRTNPRGLFRLGIYDYWNIEDWSYEKPEFSLATAIQRLDMWNLRGVSGVLIQGTNGSGPLGMVYQNAVRHVWGEAGTSTDLINRFARDAFGSAASPMARMLLRWDKNFALNVIELGDIFADLQEAQHLVDQIAQSQERLSVQLRLNDYLIYAHYLKIYYEFIEGGSNAEIAAKADKLFQFIWDVYGSVMVHSYRIHQLIYSRHLLAKRVSAGDPILDILAKWDMSRESLPVWAKLRENAVAKDDSVEYLAWVKNLFSEDIAAYPRVLGLEQKIFSGGLVPLTSNNLSNTQSGSTLYAWNAAVLAVYADRPQELTLTVAHSKPQSGFVMSVETPSGMTVYNQVIELADITTAPLQLKVPLASAGLYYIKTKMAYAGYSISVAPALPFAAVDLFTSSSYSNVKQYFYVPAQTKRVAIMGLGLTLQYLVKIYAPDGTVISPTLSREGVYVFDVPDGQDKKLWALSGVKTYAQFTFLNVPNTLSVSPNQVLVPSDAL